MARGPDSGPRLFNPVVKNWYYNEPLDGTMVYSSTLPLPIH